jgi:membrane protein implicated in regulation of membrane protease activity
VLDLAIAMGILSTTLQRKTMTTTHREESNQVDNLDKTFSMIQMLVHEHQKINVHGQTFEYVSNGKYSATYINSKGTKYTVIACQGITIKNRPKALSFSIHNLNSRAKTGKIFAIDRNLLLDC